MAALREKEDLIAIGAYQRGTDPLVDAAIDLRPAIEAFLRQGAEEPSSLAEADQMVCAIANAAASASAPAAPVAAPAPAQPVTPLHTAIPPLHLHA